MTGRWLLWLCVLPPPGRQFSLDCNQAAPTVTVFGLNVVCIFLGLLNDDIFFCVSAYVCVWEKWTNTRERERCTLSELLTVLGLCWFFFFFLNLSPVCLNGIVDFTTHILTTIFQRLFCSFFCALSPFLPMTTLINRNLVDRAVKTVMRQFVASNFRDLSIYSPGHAGVNGNEWVGRLASEAAITSDLHLGRSILPASAKSRTSYHQLQGGEEG